MTATGGHNQRAERPNTFPWPPVLLVLFLLAGFGLKRLLPLGWPGGSLDDLLAGIGIVIIAVAILIDLAAMRTLHNARTTILPHRRSDHLVTGGPFRFSRNPIYVANVMLLFGIGLFAGNAWLLLLAPLDGFATQKLAIEREEAHLETRFGKIYRDYRKKVNRWI